MWFVNKMITPDTCPYCGNTEGLESYDIDFDGEYLSIGWDCPVCEGSFDEIHKTTFEGVGMDTVYAEEVIEQQGLFEKGEDEYAD